MLSQEQHTQIVECCRELVRAQSLAGCERAAAAVAERWMRQLGYDEIATDQYGSVVGRIVGGAGPGPTLHFDGHLDTVPATALEHWTHEPYAADLVDGTIWGRGTTDMKGPVATMICAAAFLPRERLRGTITVSASVAEEELEGPALNAILRDHPADMVVICEPTLLRVGIGQRGRAGIRVTTYGRPAHSSVPHLGDNAVYRMLEVTERLRRMPLPDDPLLGHGILELVEIISSPYPGTSIIPDRCSARWDRRLVRGESRESVLADMRAALAGIDQVELAFLDVEVTCYTGATLRSDDFHPAWELAPSSPLAQAAAAGVVALGRDPQFHAVQFCTNGSGSAGELAVPTVVLGPGDPLQAHVIDEHIRIDQLADGAVAYMDLSMALCGAL